MFNCGPNSIKIRCAHRTNSLIGRAKCVDFWYEINFTLNLTKISVRLGRA